MEYMEATMEYNETTHGEYVEYNTDLLVRLSTLTKGSLLERRKEIHKSLVYATLSTYQLESEFEVKDLSADIKNITKCELDDEDVISILYQFESDGFVQHTGNLNYKTVKNVELPDFQHITQPVWDEFLPFLRKQYGDYDPFIDKDARGVFDSSLLKLLTRFTISSKSIESQIESLPIDDFKLVIEGSTKKSSLSRNLLKRYTDIVYSFMLLNPPKLSELIFDSYSGLINIDLIMREQEMPLIDFLDNIRFLLADTCFLVALMCKTDPAHPLASAVAKQCAKSNIPLYYTSRTKQEMLSSINTSKREMSGFSTSRCHGIIRSQFVADFRRQDISWNDYLIILNSWESLVKNQWQIVSTPESYSMDSIDEDIYQYAKNILPILDNVRNVDRARKDPNYIPRYREDPLVEHDALCLGVISHSRKSFEVSDGKRPMGPWFLTFDNLVSALNGVHYMTEGDFCFVIQPRTLLNYLLVYSKIQFEKEDKEAVAEAIIKYTARTPDPKLTVDDYVHLVTYKIGLDEAEIDIMKEIFLESPLLKELEKALELEHGEEADSVTYEIITHESFVETITKERKTREKLKRVAKTLRETKEELIKERAAREALERTSKQNISITTNLVTNIDVNIQNKVDSLISMLEAENAFKDGIVEKPSDISTKEKLKKWLEEVEKTIKTSETISNGIKTLLPFIAHLIGQLGGT